MRTILTFAALAMLALGASSPTHPPPAPATPSADAGTSVAVLQQGDWRLEAANACLAQMLTSEREGGGTDLATILEATGFELSKVTLRGAKRTPDRMRFGFEYVNRAQLKTLYWEADCRVDATELASRQR